MFVRSFAAVAALLALTTSAWAASPTGAFKVTGTNPGGGGTYAGTVNVTPTGDTFRVVWHVGSATITGTGLWVDEKFCVGFQGNSVAVYTDQGGDVWAGHWANGTDTRVGTERWTR